MEVSETQEFFETCRTCLSFGRKMLPVGECLDIYKKITYNLDYQDSLLNPQRLCWECHSLLKRFLKFQRQAQVANEILYMGQSHIFGSLSKLSSVVVSDEGIKTIETSEISTIRVVNSNDVGENTQDVTTECDTQEDIESTIGTTDDNTDVQDSLRIENENNSVILSDVLSIITDDVQSEELQTDSISVVTDTVSSAQNESSVTDNGISLPIKNTYAKTSEMQICNIHDNPKVDNQTENNSVMLSDVISIITDDVQSEDLTENISVITDTVSSVQNDVSIAGDTIPVQIDKISMKDGVLQIDSHSVLPNSVLSIKDDIITVSAEGSADTDIPHDCMSAPATALPDIQNEGSKDKSVSSDTRVLRKNIVDPDYNPEVTRIVPDKVIQRKSIVPNNPSVDVNINLATEPAMSKTTDDLKKTDDDIAKEKVVTEPVIDLYKDAKPSTSKRPSIHDRNKRGRGGRPKGSSNKPVTDLVGSTAKKKFKPSKWTKRKAILDKKPKFQYVERTTNIVFVKHNTTLQEVQKNLELERQAEEFVNVIWKCKKCVVTFKDGGALVGHNKKCHSEKYPHTCEVCLQTFPETRHLAAHLKNHLHVYQCRICRAVCQSRAQGEAHLASHEEVLQCLTCEALVDNEEAFIIHYQDWHENYECDTCGVKYKLRYCIKDHIKKKHSNFECKRCDKVFFTYKARWVHDRMTHTKGGSTVCADCGKTYKDSYRLARHVACAANHGPQRKYPCMECDKTFSKPIYATEHFNFVHLKVHKHKCDKCDKIYLRNADLTKHKREKHEGILPPRNKICDVCGRGFTANKTLENHKRTHTGEKPFACSRCPARFAQAVALTSHTRAVHKENPIRKK